MEIDVLEEHDDGSATVTLSNIEPRMLQLLLQEGFMSLLTKNLAQMEQAGKLPALLKRSVDEV